MESENNETAVSARDKFKINFRAAFKRSGVSQKEIAAHLGKTRGAISHWLNGVAMPKGADAVRLAGILKVTVDELFN